MPPSEEKPPPSAVSTFISSANTKSPLEALAYEILHNLRYQHRWNDLKVHSLSTNTALESSTSTSPSTNTATATARTQSPPRSITSSLTSIPTITAHTHISSIRHNQSHNSAGTGIGTKQSTTSSSSHHHNDTIFLVSGLPPRNMYVHPDLQKRMLRENIDESRLQIQREWVLPLSIGEKWTLKRFCTVFTALPERDPVNVTADVPTIPSGTADDGERSAIDGEAEASHVDDDANDAGNEDDEDDVSITASNANGSGIANAEEAEQRVSFTWQDKKRVLLGMLAHNGMGGDGTIAYYIMQEGEVKPRQNG